MSFKNFNFNKINSILISKPNFGINSFHPRKKILYIKLTLIESDNIKQVKAPSKKEREYRRKGVLIRQTPL